MKLERDIKAEMMDADPTLKSRGFGKMLRKLEASHDELWEMCGVYARHPIVPDLYLCDQDTQRITVYEIEVHHPMPRAKIAMYWRLFDMLAPADWELRLYTVDRYQNINELDMAGVGFDCFLENMEATRIAQQAERMAAVAE